MKLPDFKKATTTNELYDIVESVLIDLAYRNSSKIVNKCLQPWLLSWGQIAYDISIDLDFDGQYEIVEFLLNAETMRYDLDVAQIK